MKVKLLGLAVIAAPGPAAPFVSEVVASMGSPGWTLRGRR